MLRCKECECIRPLTRHGTCIECQTEIDNGGVEREENKLLRKLLWLRHGCDIPSLYGDDGELQCSKCMIDFKRMSAVEIEKRWREIVKTRLEHDPELREKINNIFNKE